MAYVKSSDGTDTVISVTPEPLTVIVPGPIQYLGAKLRSVWWWLAIIFLSFITIPLLMFLTLAQAVSSFAVKKIVTSEMSNPTRSPAQIRVNRDRIAAGGAVVAVGDITRILIRNHLTPERARLAGATALDLGDSGARARAAGLRARAALIAEIEKVSFRLDVEHGGKVTTITGGLSEAEAFAVAKDIQIATGIACQT